MPVICVIHVHGHALHVVRYANFIAEEIGLSAERIQTIRHAGLLHDPENWHSGNDFV